MKTTATTFIVTALATTSSFLPVAANCGMSNFQIKTSTTQNEQVTEKEVEETQHNVGGSVGATTTSRRDLRQKGGKSSKEPDHNECDVETLQRAIMCAEYTFKTLNTDGDDVLGKDDWRKYLERDSSGEADREMKVFHHTCGSRFDNVDCPALATVASTKEKNMTRVEWETEMIIVFCENDATGFPFDTVACVNVV